MQLAIKAIRERVESTKSNLEMLERKEKELYELKKQECATLKELNELLNVIDPPRDGAAMTINGGDLVGALKRADRLKD